MGFAQAKNASGRHPRSRFREKPLYKKFGLGIMDRTWLKGQGAPQNRELSGENEETR
jgi:hypothetical protein